MVEHFFVTTTHHWLLFFTNTGRVYRAKAYEVQEAGRDAKGQHVANLLALQPDEEIAQVLDIRDYTAAKYLALATRGGLVKKTRLTEYDTNRTGGIIAINLREGDELVSAMLVEDDSEILLVSRKGMSLRFVAEESSLRADGPLDLRRDRHALPRRRRAARRPRSCRTPTPRPCSWSPRAATRSAPRSTSTGRRDAADWASRSRS